MLPGAGLFIDKVNLITGPGAGSGKTTFVRRAMAAVHAQGNTAAVLAVGLEGDRSAGLASNTSRGKIIMQSASQFAFLPGDVFLTTSAYLDTAGCQPEILDVLPGSSALGRLALARARRAGTVVLVGPEHNEYLALAVSRIRENAWTSTIFIDGALNRITQAASVSAAQLFYTVRVSRSDCKNIINRMKYLLDLLSLPLYQGDPGLNTSKAVFIDGALTDSTAERLGNGEGIVVVNDFSRIFLDQQAFKRFRGSTRLQVQNKVTFGGFSIILRSISKNEFKELAGSELMEKIISWNIWEGGDTLNGAH